MSDVYVSDNFPQFWSRGPGPPFEITPDLHRLENFLHFWSRGLGPAPKLFQIKIAHEISSNFRSADRLRDYIGFVSAMKFRTSFVRRYPPRLGLYLIYIELEISRTPRIPLYPLPLSRDEILSFVGLYVTSPHPTSPHPTPIGVL